MRDFDYVRDEALDTEIDWDAGGHGHNWKNHIGPRIRKIWPSLSDEMKAVLALDAQDRADKEEWD